MRDWRQMINTPTISTATGTVGLYYIMFDDETPDIASSSGGFLSYSAAEKAADEIMMLEPPSRTYKIFLKE